MPDIKETAAELISRFDYAHGFRQQYDAKAVECYKLYVGYREGLDEAHEGRSNLHIPRTYEQMDTWRARLVKAFFGVSRPFIDFLPMPGVGATPAIMAANEEKAKRAAALVDMQLERNCIVREFYDFVTGLLIFPAAIFGIGWRYERKQVRRRVPIIEMVPDPMTGMPTPVTVGWTVVEQEATAWDDNEIVNLNYFDFWPDPRGRSIDACRFVFQREWLTQDQLDERLEVLDAAGGGTVYPLNYEELRGETGEFSEGAWELLSSVGLTPETSDGFWPREGKAGHLFEVLHYWEDERHALLVNRKQVAYDGANPYWRHGRKPFVAVSFEPLPGQFYGMSAVQLIAHLQHELNTQRNQRIDNVSFVLNRMWKVRRGADIDESELVSRPHGIVHVDAPDDVTEFAMNDVTSSSYNDEGVTKQDMENTLGTPGVVRGVNPTRKETATTSSLLTSNASIRFDVKIALFDALGIKRLAYLMDCNNQQFVDQPRLVRLFGENGSADWQVVEPGDLMGEFDYRPAGANTDPAANKEVRRQQLSQALAFVIQSNNPYVKKYELTREWLSTFDFRNVDKFLYTEQEVQAMMQAAQAQAQVLAGAAVGAGPPDTLAPLGGSPTPGPPGG